MSAPNPILTVFRKETMEMLRDKRVRNAALVMPIVVMFLMASLFGVIASTVGGKSKQTVHIVRTDDPLLAQIRQSDRLKVVTVPDKAAGVKLIQDGKARLVVEMAKVGQQQRITFLFDPKEDSSEVAKAGFMSALQPIIKEQAREMLRAFNMTPEQAEPIAFKDEPVTVGEGPGASGLIVGLLPYMIVLFSFVGGFAMAGDLVAGEKEKSTLETLLITPVRRTQIVLGKFLALCVLCLTSAVSAMVGLAIVSQLRTPGSEVLFKSGLGLTPKAVGLIVLLLLPLVALFAGVLLAVSAFAKNTREAQTYLSFVNLLVVIPAAFSQILGITGIASQTWINLVPVLGTAGNIRAALLGKPSLIPMALSIGVSAVLAAVALVAAIRLFNREEVLVRV